MPSSTKAFEKGAEREKQMEVDINGVEASMEAVPYYSELDFFQEDNDIAHADMLLYEELQLMVQSGALDDLYINIVSPPFQAYMDDDLAMLCSHDDPRDSQPTEMKSPFALPSASLEILRQCISRVGGVNGERRDKAKEKRPSPPTLLSVYHTIELAVVNFTYSIYDIGKNISSSMHPYKTVISRLLKGDSKDVQLVQYLLLCAEEVSNHRYDCACELLQKLSKLSCSPANVIQRLVYYFADSLREKIHIEKGVSVNARPIEFIPHIPMIAKFLDKLPFNQVVQFAAIQEILDHVSSCRKVHFINLGIFDGGLGHAVFMQAITAASECSLEHLKVTTVLTQSNLLLIEEAGIRLRKLAKSLNLTFSFHVISLEDILDPHKNVLRLDHEEAVVVQATHTLKIMIPKAEQLEKLMNVIRRIKPHVMIIIEVEANIDSPVFVNRFVETLAFFGAGFDYVENVLKNDDRGRDIIESKFFSPSIKRLFAAEEEGRSRHKIVGINVWREILARFGMVEKELGKVALSHATSVLKMFDCRDSCKLGLNGNSLIVAWKDTPILSLSSWKFRQRSESS